MAMMRKNINLEVIIFSYIMIIISVIEYMKNCLKMNRKCQNILLTILNNEVHSDKNALNNAFL